MKITTVGTSHGDPTLTRKQTSTLLETQGRYYLIDAGEGINTFLVRNDLRASMLRGIFITHMHIDHTSSLPVLIEQAIKYRWKDEDIKLEVQLPEACAIEPLQNWIKTNAHKVDFSAVNFDCYRDKGGFDDGFIKVTPFPTNHIPPLEDGLTRSHSLLIEAEGKKIIFTGDVSCDDRYRDFPSKAAENCDIVFSEIVHYKPEYAVEVLSDLNFKELVFVHVGNKWQTPEGEEELMKICKDLPCKVTMSRDGMVFEL